MPAPVPRATLDEMRQSTRWTARLQCALLTWLGLSCSARAQDCDCDHQVSPGTGTVNAAELGVLPGQRVCVQAGDYDFIRFQQVRGTAEAWVTIVNCGGQVRVHNPDRAYGLVIEGESQYFRLLGTGDPDQTYGFRVSVPAVDPWPGVGLALGDKSTNYEVSHIEIHDTGFAGVTAKTDPVCDGSADQDQFVQRDIELHHLYVHDTGGEGFYVGSTQSDGQTITCDGTDEVHQPHFLEGVRLHHNLVERTAWDGMQVGMARADCLVYANTISGVGSAGVEYQQQGLQIGTYSSCEVSGNVIHDGPVMGIIVLGAGVTRIHNNLITGFGEDGIYANHRDVASAATYDFFFNTIVDYGGTGIRVFGAELAASSAVDNLLVGPSPHISAGSEVDWSEDHNVTLEAASTAGFVGVDDYHLRDASPARGAGRPLPDIDHDLEGRLRADPPSVGAYEHAGDSPGQAGATTEPPPPLSTGGTSSTTEDDASTGSGERSGCGCRAGRHAPSATGWLALAFLALVLGARQRRPAVDG